MVQLIIGHTTTDAAKIWVKGDWRAGTAAIELKHNGLLIFHAIVTLNKKEYNTATITAGGLQQDTPYTVHVEFDKGKPVHGQLKTLPVAVNTFNFILASCHFTFLPKLSDPAFKRIAEVATNNACRFMIHCGDQIYIDTVIRPFWIWSRFGYMRKYWLTWFAPEVKKVLGALPQYMIVDDHEIYNNFVNDKLNWYRRKLFGWAMNTYNIFQHAHNPSTENVLYYNFSCAHADFFVMDLRTERTKTQIVNQRQMMELSKWLNQGTPDRVKCIVSSVPLFTQMDEREQKDRWSDKRYSWQRDELIAMLMESDNKKVAVFSGDIHLAAHSSLTYTQNGKTYTIHELISSPLNQVSKNILSDKPQQVIQINDTNLDYQLGKHMGYPVKSGEQKNTRQNNFMCVTVTRDKLSYKVYPAGNGEVLFEDGISL